MSETNNIDDRLVSWLYGELDAAEAERLEAEMGKDPELAAEAESLRHTREMVSQLEDEEPPAALSSFLLHAAAKEVATAPAGSESDEKPGLWASILAGFRSLGARPALAAAAALVVVVGVAGVLVSQGGSDLAQESAQSDRAAGQPAPTGNAEPGATASASDGEVASKDEAKLEEEADFDGEGEAPPVPADEPVPSERVGQLAASEERQAVADEVVRREQKKSKRKKQLSYPNKPKPTVARRGRKGGGGKDDSSRFAAEPATNAVSGGAPLAKEGDRQDKSVATGGMLGAPGAPTPKRPYAQSQAMNDKWAEGQLGRLSAKNIKCGQVATIANNILDRNPKFYYKRVRGSKKVQACRWYVSRETTRRKRLRNKQGAGSGDSAVAAPRKRRAAPARNDAYESSAESAK